MKRLSILSLAVLSVALLCASTLSLTGCAVAGSRTRSAINEVKETVAVVLEALVPQDFVGDLTLRSAATGIGYDIRFTGLHWSTELARFTWDGFEWNRDGFWSMGGIELVPRPRIPSGASSFAPERGVINWQNLPSIWAAGIASGDIILTPVNRD